MISKAKATTVSNPLLHGEPEVPAEVLASEIVAVSKAVKELLSSRLSEKALYILLAHSSGLSQAKCKLVMTSAANLASDYVRSKKG